MILRAGIGRKDFGSFASTRPLLSYLHVDVDVVVVLDVVADAVVCVYVQAHDSDYVSVYDYVQVHVHDHVHDHVHVHVHALIHGQYPAGWLGLRGSAAASMPASVRKSRLTVPMCGNVLVL